MKHGAPDGPHVIPQPVATPLSLDAVFLVVTVNPALRIEQRFDHFLSRLGTLVRWVGFREA
jgi:hypothetical protein